MKGKKSRCARARQCVCAVEDTRLSFRSLQTENGEYPALVDDGVGLEKSWWHKPRSTRIHLQLPAV